MRAHILIALVFGGVLAACDAPPPQKDGYDPTTRAAEDERAAAEYERNKSIRLGCGARGYIRYKERICQDGCSNMLFNSCVCFTTYHEECNP
jgi:hypothetical protein